MLGEVAGGDDALGRRHSVVLDENDLEPVAHDRVVVDHVSDRSNELDNLFRRVVSLFRIQITGIFML